MRENKTPEEQLDEAKSLPSPSLEFDLESNAMVNASEDDSGPRIYGPRVKRFGVTVILAAVAWLVVRCVVVETDLVT